MEEKGSKGTTHTLIRNFLIRCSFCRKKFGDWNSSAPYTFGCGHTICSNCLASVEDDCCPVDNYKSAISVRTLPPNTCILYLIEVAVPANAYETMISNHGIEYYQSMILMEKLVCVLNPNAFKKINNQVKPINLAKSLERKLISLASCQLLEELGRKDIIKYIRKLGERILLELILLMKSRQQQVNELFAALRSLKCQLFGPKLQEMIMRLLYNIMNEGERISRKTLTAYLIHQLDGRFKEESKNISNTSIGRAIQLLVRGSCFEVIPRDKGGSLLKLKDEIRNYEQFRQKLDAAVIKVAFEYDVHLKVEKWSLILYGSTDKSQYLNSMIDKLRPACLLNSRLKHISCTLNEEVGKPFQALRKLIPQFSRIEMLNPDDEYDLAKVKEMLEVAVEILYALLEYSEHFGKAKDQRQENAPTDVVVNPPDIITLKLDDPISFNTLDNAADLSSDESVDGTDDLIISPVPSTPLKDGINRAVGSAVAISP
ncbi:uncharacterized protein TRIADDRAFT_53314 [Trichoplax adhaerens]|uniref:RING-type E3 ubiquitin transferase n=1 Tax=Trichoplax adhaerens TaxID=10228 RepID=B3RNW3_TRIAD|nr:hypothetical protein TRIADDRAFT_53314 [Trichoplax adhaerens]EDV27531.1 hypothetical protein TRIADDRAFT_53314 [Trichoplax adhaerens]|eukprot:XP_002109365.1 hypothetical protein TRIADDRAFT_53314 [Trichoplax adhaerens]